MICASPSRKAFAALALGLLGCASPPRPAEVAITPLPSAQASAAPAAETSRHETVRPDHIDKTVTFDDCEWVVVEARDAGQRLESTSELSDEVKTTPGRFIQVHFKITNRTKREEMILDVPKIRDAKGREFGPIDMQSFYVPPKARTIGLDSLQPDLQKDYWTTIEVAPDAKQLVFVVHGLSTIGDKRTVDLGL